MKHTNLSSFPLRENERAKERLSTRKTLQREEHASSHSPLKGRVLWGTLGAALVILVALVVLVACPAAPSGGGGTGYICDNGTPSSLRDVSADGLTRCVSCDHPLFFALEGSSDAIGTTCRTVAEVGEAVRIDTVSNFGVLEGNPTGLAAINGTLYMVGEQTDVLYTLNTDSADGTDDGAAIQVGSTAAGFGVVESLPTGLAAINGTLYMVGERTDLLYTLDTTTGRATQVSAASVNQFGVGESNPSDLAAIANTLYMAGDNDVLYTLNTATGRATRVGSTDAGFGVSELNARGLAAIGSTLYMVGNTNDVLYTLNTTTGMAIQVGSAAAGFGVGESFPTGLAAIDSTLYMVGSTNDALYALRYR